MGGLNCSDGRSACFRPRLRIKAFIITERGRGHAVTVGTRPSSAMGQNMASVGEAWALTPDRTERSSPATLASKANGHDTTQIQQFLQRQVAINNMQFRPCFPAHRKTRRTYHPRLPGPEPLRHCPGLGQVSPRDQPSHHRHCFIDLA